MNKLGHELSPTEKFGVITRTRTKDEKINTTREPNVAIKISQACV
jgi:hypothetical protein